MIKIGNILFIFIFTFSIQDNNPASNDNNSKEITTETIVSRRKRKSWPISEIIMGNEIIQLTLKNHKNILFTTKSVTNYLFHNNYHTTNNNFSREFRWHFVLLSRLL